jgi:hypothetical protein
MVIVDADVSAPQVLVCMEDDLETMPVHATTLVRPAHSAVGGQPGTGTAAKGAHCYSGQVHSLRTRALYGDL